MEEKKTICQECGMELRRGDYHPFAACLMFKACGDRETVQRNLIEIQNAWKRIGYKDAMEQRAGARRDQRNAKDRAARRERLTGLTV